VVDHPEMPRNGTENGIGLVHKRTVVEREKGTRRNIHRETYIVLVHVRTAHYAQKYKFRQWEQGSKNPIDRKRRNQRCRIDSRRYQYQEHVIRNRRKHREMQERDPKRINITEREYRGML
jgi:hypothetical protein